jgi:hypothetical protein
MVANSEWGLRWEEGWSDDAAELVRIFWMVFFVWERELSKLTKLDSPALSAVFLDAFTFLQGT